MSDDGRKKRKTLIDLLLEAGQPISPQLAELLVAYGSPVEMPAYQGTAVEYANAVRIFERLSATAEAAARRDAMERYFSGVRYADQADARDATTGSL